MNYSSKFGFRKSLNCSSTVNGLLFGTNPGDTILIETQEIWIKDLILLLDGTKNILDIQSLLKQKGHNISKDNIIEKIQLFYENSLLDKYDTEISYLSGHIFNEAEIERYDRQLLLFKSITGDNNGANEIQIKLKNSKVCLIGVGGIGSYVFYALAAMGIGHITAVDFDKVELSNLSRQILYGEDDIDQYKVDVAKRKSKHINSNVTYKFINDIITDVEKAIEIMNGHDLIILCADIPRGKIGSIINEASYKLNIPVIYGGSSRTWLTCGPIIVPNETKCYDCFFNVDMKHFNSKDEEIVNFIRNRYTTTLIDPYNSMAGAIISLETVKFLTEFQKSRLIGEMMMIDTDDYTITKVASEGNDNCVICGNGNDRKIYQLFG